MSRNSLYSVKSVSEITGIKPITLRAWERRYELVSPRRVDGQRMYSEAEVARLEQLARLVARGHRIGELARLEDDALEALERRTAGTEDATVSALIAALEDFDVDEIDQRLGMLFGSGPIDERVSDLLGELFSRVGRSWQAGKLSIAQERLLSQAVMVRIMNILHTVPARDGYRIVCATPPGEHHELGLLLFAFQAASTGLPVRYLGTDLPLSEVARTCRALKADVAALSMTRKRSGDEIRAFVAELDEAFADDQRVWIGGSGVRQLPDKLPARVSLTHDTEDTDRMLREYRLVLAESRS